MPFAVPGDLRITAGALAARIARAYPAGDDPFGPRLVLAVAEDLAPQPIRAFLVSPLAERPLFRVIGNEVLEHQQGCTVRLSELHNAPTHPVCHLLIEMAHPVPQSGVIGFALRNETSLGPATCNASQRGLPKAVC